MRNEAIGLRKAVTACVLSAIVLTITIGTLLVLGHVARDPIGGPQQAFEAHLLALDEQNWEVANLYVAPGCATNGETAKAARRDLKSKGFSFSQAFTVEKVWISEDGTEALLDLSPPANLPLPGVASMERVDGDWLVSCT